MITRIVKFSVLPEFKTAFLSYMSTFLPQAKAFKNNHHVDFFEDMESPNNFHIYTIWKTNGALQKFRKSPLNIDFKKQLSTWGEKPYSAWTVENIQD